MQLHTSACMPGNAADRNAPFHKKKHGNKNLSEKGMTSFRTLYTCINNYSIL